MSHSEQKSIRCVVVTPEKKVFDGEADFVAIPVFDGELGVLPGRAPLVARLGPGELRLTRRAGTSERFFVDGGFGQVKNNVITILTPRAQAAGSLDRAQLDRELAEINAERAQSDANLDKKALQLARIRAQRRMAHN